VDILFFLLCLSVCVSVCTQSSLQHCVSLPQRISHLPVGVYVYCLRAPSSSLFDSVSFVSGTNVDAARDILDKSGLAITTGDNFEDAAIKAVASLKQ